MRSVAAILLLCLAPAAFAQDGQSADFKAHVAEIVTLVKAAPLLCPWIEADEDAIHGLMERACITDRDIMDPNVFGTQDELIAHSFAHSRQTDGDQACVDVFATVGPDWPKLLRRRP